MINDKQSQQLAVEPFAIKPFAMFQLQLLSLLLYWETL